MTYTNRYSFYKLSELFRFIRNTLTHFAETIAKKGVKIAFSGDTLEDYIQYINGQFPWLLIFAQTIIDRASE